MKLYKYLSTDAAMAFLKEPALRLSQNNSQNDPFEVLSTEIDLNRIKDATQKTIKICGKEFNSHRDITPYLDLYGYVSLSKNKESMPMWGNYATNNKGILVEFEVGEEDPLSMFDIDKTNDNDAYLSDNVIYNRERCYSKTINNFSAEEINNFSKHYFFSKHESWKYEEEYRFALPFTNCNKVITLGNSNQTKNKLSSLGYKGDLAEEINDLTDLFYLAGFCKNSISKWNSVWRNYDAYQVMFLIKINPNKISRIYLGVNSDVEKMKEAIIEGSLLATGNRGRFYNSFENFKDVYKCKLDRNLFKLKYEKLT
jgi:hypothetical protein